MDSATHPISPSPSAAQLEATLATISADDAHKLLTNVEASAMQGELSAAQRECTRLNLEIRATEDELRQRQSIIEEQITSKKEAVRAAQAEVTRLLGRDQELRAELAALTTVAGGSSDA